MGARIRIKMHEDDLGICATCNWCIAVKNESLEVYAQCRYLEKQINAKITHCTEYKEKMTLSYSELKQMAWIIDPASTKSKIGFIRPGTLEHKAILKKPTDEYDPD